MKSLSKEQKQAVLGIAKSSSERDWVALVLAFDHALRVSEVVALTPQNFSGGFLTVARLKGSRRTVQPLIEGTRLAVEAWVTQFSVRQPIFGIKRSMLSKLYRRYARLAGLPEHLRGIHSAKFTTGMLALEGGAKINAVQKYMGHASLASTGRYLEIGDAKASKECQAAMAA